MQYTKLAKWDFLFYNSNMLILQNQAYLKILLIENSKRHIKQTDDQKY
jgi:hypothetical protein